MPINGWPSDSATHPRQLLECERRTSTGRPSAELRGPSQASIQNVPLAETAPSSNWPDQLAPDRIHREVTGDTNGPNKSACREPCRNGALRPYRASASGAGGGSSVASALSRPL